MLWSLRDRVATGDSQPFPDCLKEDEGWALKKLQALRAAKIQRGVPSPERKVRFHTSKIHPGGLPAGGG